MIPNTKLLELANITFMHFVLGERCLIANEQRNNKYPRCIAWSQKESKLEDS